MADELIAGRYRLLEPLGRGAMSSVWLAQDEELGRRVAVKTLMPRADHTRFAREARSAASLSHPNICSLYDYGEENGKPFMVLEYLPNGSLEERLGGGALDDDEALRISLEIAAGLAHAHERDLVHRDLKPANVLFDAEGRAKIADFGIARMGSQGTVTEAGTVLGTASYISPEQAGGLPAGPASDVYSFGVILFRMLTGRLPFVSSNAMDLVRMHRDDPPPEVGAFRRDAPARLESIVAASLAKDPALRPPDGTALLQALRGSRFHDSEADATIVVAPSARAATEATQVLRPTPVPARRRQRSRRALWLPLVAAVLVLLGGGIGLALLTGGGGSSAPTTLPGLSLPKITTTGSTPTTATTTATTTAATTTTPTPTAPAATPSPAPTTAPVTTTPPTTTTAPSTTAPTTTVAPTTATATTPTTTAPVTTTNPASTVTTP